MEEPHSWQTTNSTVWSIGWGTGSIYLFCHCLSQWIYCSCGHLWCSEVSYWIPPPLLFFFSFDILEVSYTDGVLLTYFCLSSSVSFRILIFLAWTISSACSFQLLLYLWRELFLDIFQAPCLHQFLSETSCISGIPFKQASHVNHFHPLHHFVYINQISFFSLQQSRQTQSFQSPLICQVFQA